ncbi:hypothetical protein FKM82_028514 [Ascaphus truei]
MWLLCCLRSSNLWIHLGHPCGLEKDNPHLYRTETILQSRYRTETPLPTPDIRQRQPPPSRYRTETTLQSQNRTDNLPCARY